MQDRACHVRGILNMNFLCCLYDFDAVPLLAIVSHSGVHFPMVLYSFGLQSLHVYLALAFCDGS